MRSQGMECWNVEMLERFPCPASFHYSIIPSFLKYCFTILFLTPSFWGGGEGLQSQNKKIDSLRILLKTDKEDTNKVKHLNDLAWEFRFENPDSSIVLGKQAQILCEQYSSNKTLKANVTGNLGVYFYLNADYRSALDYFFAALKIDEATGNKKGMAVRLGNIGSVYRSLANYQKALDYFFKCLKIMEELNDRIGISSCLNNLGTVCLKQSDFPKAIEYYKKALLIRETLDDKFGIAIVTGNLGSVYQDMGELDISLDYQFKTLKLREELGAKSLITNTLGNIGNVYLAKHNYPQALLYSQKALDFAKELGAKNLIAESLGSVGSIYVLQGKYSIAHEYLFKALVLDIEAEIPDAIEEDYNLLSSLYEKATIALPDSIGGKLLNMEQMRLKSLYYFKKHISIRDTLLSEENKKQLVRKEMNFEFEKKEAETKAEQDKKNATQEADSKKQKVIMFSVIGCLLLVICFAGFIFQSLRKTRRQKLIIEHQKLIVDGKQKEILDSIRYARRIQTALITSEKYIERKLNKMGCGL